jgi:hypothetical protein
MKSLWVAFLLFAIFAETSPAQHVQTLKPDRGRILHVQTALNHLSILEMTEPVTTVAVGSPLFKVEWRENKVFIKPLQADVATNLFVWTASGRFNYELDVPGPVSEMDFAVDQPIPDPPPVKPTSAGTPDAKELSPAEVLIESKPVHIYGSIPEKNHVNVYLRDLFEKDSKLVIHYSIRNETNKPYTPGMPQVLALSSPRYRESLYTLSNYQLSPNALAHLKSDGQTQLAVATNQGSADLIAPGKEANGIITINVPQDRKGPIVLRILFLAAPSGPISATLVL